MARPQEFPFNIMDVAELLHLHIRRRQADSVYADCPICGDKRGKMNINFAKNLWRCNYCNEGGGMLALYGKVYGISNSEAYREICDTLQNGLTAPEYTAKELPEQAADRATRPRLTAGDPPDVLHAAGAADAFAAAPQASPGGARADRRTDRTAGVQKYPALLPVPVTGGKAAQPRLQGGGRSGLLCRQG